MGTNFEDVALADLMYWVQNDRKIAGKIYNLIQDINRNGADKGIGKPERLKHMKGWSRRIDQKNRMVYDIDKDGNVHIVSCKGHYEE